MKMETTFEPMPSGGLAQYIRMVGAFERDDIEAAVDLLIARLDAADGNPDIEANGDELDGDGSEDDFMRHTGNGPGCHIADIDKGDEEDGDATTWAEWHTMHTASRRAGKTDGTPRNASLYSIHEDEEEDDPAGGNITDVPHDDEEDFSVDDKGEGGSWPEQIEQDGSAGHHYDDDGQEDDNVATRLPHRDRIRRTRCDLVYMGRKPYGWSEWYLREGSGRGGRTIGVA